MSATSARPRVVVFDPLSAQIEWSYDVERGIFAEQGVDLVVPASAVEADDVVRDADVVIVNALRGMNAETIATLNNPVGLLAYSIGMNQIDQDAAAARGIPVGNTPFCVDEVADQAMALLLAVERRLVPFVQAVAENNWDYTRTPMYPVVHKIRGRTLGIIGTGRIGTQIARRAAPFGYNIIGYDPYVESTPAPIQKVDFDTLLRGSDSIVLAPSLTSTSRGILSRDALAKVKRGVNVVNIARGALVDEDALAAALKDGRVGYAALDVRADEPPKTDNDPLTGLPNVIGTPHIAGMSVEARQAIHTMAAEAALAMLRAGGRLGERQAEAAGTAS